MIEVIIYDRITNKQMEQLILFVKKYCNIFSIENDYDGKVSQKTYQAIQNELARYFQKEDEERRMKYQIDKEYQSHLNKVIGIKNERQAKKYFDDLKKEDKSVFERFVIEKGNLEEEVYIPAISEGFLYNKISRMTEKSVGGLYNILYYKLSSLDSIMKNMKSLFDYIYLEDVQFWNLTFYKDKKVILQICTDRKEIQCHLDRIQYDEFQKLKVPFEII